MAKAFAWTMKSPIAPSNYGLRSDFDKDHKVFDNLVPVLMQLGSAEERKHFVRLCVELVPAGLSSSSFRKVITKLVFPTRSDLSMLVLHFSSRIFTLKLPMKMTHTFSTLWGCQKKISLCSKPSKGCWLIFPYSHPNLFSWLNDVWQKIKVILQSMPMFIFICLSQATKILNLML